MVQPKFQELGMGKKLMRRRIKEIIKNPEVEKILVRTTPQAENFNKKMGFEKRHFKKDFWAPGFDLCEMEMKVKD